VSDHDTPPPGTLGLGSGTSHKPDRSKWRHRFSLFPLMLIPVGLYIIAASVQEDIHNVVIVHIPWLDTSVMPVHPMWHTWESGVTWVELIFGLATLLVIFELAALSSPGLDQIGEVIVILVFVFVYVILTTAAIFTDHMAVFKTVQSYILLAVCFAEMLAAFIINSNSLKKWYSPT
jgi:hypothetical protein